MSPMWKARTLLAAGVMYLGIPSALAVEASAPRTVAEKERCASEIEASLRSLQAAPESNLPAVISSTSSESSRATQTKLAIRSHEPFPPQYAEMLDEFFLKAGDDPIFPFPDWRSQRWLDYFLHEAAGSLGITVSGTPLEKLRQLKAHPRINGFAPQDPEDREQLSTTFLSMWSQHKGGDPNSWSRGNEYRYIVRSGSHVSETALNRVVADHLPQYMQIWEDYFVMVDQAKKKPLREKIRQFLIKHDLALAAPIATTGLASGMFGSGAAMYHLTGGAEGPTIMTGIIGMVSGAMWAIHSFDKIQKSIHFTEITLRSKSMLQKSHETLARAAVARAETSRVDRAWTAWSESTALSRQRKLAIAESSRGNADEINRFDRAWAIEMTNAYAEDTLQAGLILKKLAEAELPNGMKFSELKRLQSSQISGFGTELSTTAARRKEQLKAIRSHLEETAFSIEDTLRETHSERIRLRQALSHSSEAVPESSSTHGSYLRQLDTAVDLLKIQLEQAHQLIASAAQEIQLTEHLEELVLLHEKVR